MCEDKRAELECMERSGVEVVKNLALSPTLTGAARPTAVLVGWLLMTVPAFAKQVGEALSDMSEVEQSDPGGYTLMVFCIALLFVVASTLIGVTTWFMLKGKKKAK
jgi:hypothetical protein